MRLLTNLRPQQMTVVKNFPDEFHSNKIFSLYIFFLSQGWCRCWCQYRGLVVVWSCSDCVWDGSPCTISTHESCLGDFPWKVRRKVFTAVSNWSKLLDVNFWQVLWLLDGLAHLISWSSSVCLCLLHKNLPDRTSRLLLMTGAIYYVILEKYMHKPTNHVIFVFLTKS